MKSLLKILLSIIFFISFTLLSPSPVQANFACNSDGASIDVYHHDSDYVTVVVILTNVDDNDVGAENFNLMYMYEDPNFLMGTNEESWSIYDPDNEKITVAFLVPKTTLVDQTMDINPYDNTKDILFHVVNPGPGGDYCSFYLDQISLRWAYHTANDGTWYDNPNDPITPPDDDNGGIPPIAITTNCEDDQISTGLGCIPADPMSLAVWILQAAMLAGGGIAFLLSVFGGITIILAAGDPEKINQGKQMITSAIAGVLFIILAISLLRLIAFDIFQLPGFENPL